MGNEVLRQKFSGYILNPSTSQNFSRMKKNGIPLPPFKVEDNVTRIVSAIYSEVISDIEKIIIRFSAAENINLVSDSAFGDLIKDIKSLLKRAIDKSRLRIFLDRAFSDSRSHFFRQFFSDAPAPIVNKVSGALDADQVFQEHLEELKKSYIAESIDRIQGEVDDLRKGFLTKFVDWMEGESEAPDFKSIVAEMKKQTGNRARFFARDQFSRFNKSLTVSSYKKAEVEKVQWYPVRDQRTRPTHRTEAIKLKYGSDIFPIDKLPEERHDSNCRCALLAVVE